MTEKLYLYDSYLRKAGAVVTGVEKLRGRRAYLELDRTIFHPLYGGQPSDRGAIRGGGREFVVKKVIVKYGRLLHYGVFREKYLFGVGERVEMILDWEYRYRVMKLHTAGHILDYAVAKVYGELVETLSAFHGPPRPYLEYSVLEEPPVEEIEYEANRIVSQDLPVIVRFVEAGELERYIYNAPNLDRVPEADVYRVVEIRGVNAMPCTGTHVKRTGEVGEIKITDLEKTEKGWRIFYTAGET